MARHDSNFKTKNPIVNNMIKLDPFFLVPEGDYRNNYIKVKDRIKKESPKKERVKQFYYNNIDSYRVYIIMLLYNKV